MNPLARTVGSIVLLAGTLLASRSKAAEPTTRPSIDEQTRSLADAWKDRLQGEGLQYVLAAPFVIAGDGGKEKLAQYRDRTVLAAAQSLRAMYFKTEPSEPILILLFESAGPYERVSRKWFGEKHAPHFGYYQPKSHAMVMNVATGTGTLVHELTHALIHPDFPGVPAWFNEGLASLYEQSTLGPRTITGHENWRLPSLQKAIRDKSLRSLESMINDPNFYGLDLVGINYAQARYLMFYLQEKQLLTQYYREFRDHYEKDNNGLETLKTLIAPRELSTFEAEWHAWVLSLHFE